MSFVVTQHEAINVLLFKIENSFINANTYYVSVSKFQKQNANITKIFTNKRTKWSWIADLITCSEKISVDVKSFLSPKRGIILSKFKTEFLVLVK